MALTVNPPYNWTLGHLRVTDPDDETKSLFIFFGDGPPTPFTTEVAATDAAIYVQARGPIYTLLPSGDWAVGGGSSLLGGFRSERLVVVTDTADPGNVVWSGPYSDDDGGAPAINNTGFSVGDYIIFAAGTAPVLRKVTAVGAGDITLSSPEVALSERDVFATRHYLPDPAGGESYAVVIVGVPGIAKIGDIDWNNATGITLSSGFVFTSGTVTAGDTVEAAIAKLAGRLNDYKEQAGVTTDTILDSVPSTTRTVKWLVEATLDSDPEQIRAQDWLVITTGVNGVAPIPSLNNQASTKPPINIDVRFEVAAGSLNIIVSAGAATTFKSRRFEV
jgi:hypothetical protein